MKNKKGFSPVVIILIVGILIAISVFMSVKKGQQITQTQQPKAAAIQNDSDLDATAADLDNTDVDGIGTELNQMDADASTF